MQNTGSEQLRAWMTRTGHTKQSAVAEMCEIHESYLSMILNGDRVPGRDVAVKIEALTGVPVRAWTLSGVHESEARATADDRKRRSHKR